MLTSVMVGKTNYLLKSNNKSSFLHVSSLQSSNQELNCSYKMNIKRVHIMNSSLPLKSAAPNEIKINIYANYFKLIKLLCYLTRRTKIEFKF